MAVAITADTYLRTYPNDESDKGQRSTVYNSGTSFGACFAAP